MMPNLMAAQAKLNTLSQKPHVLNQWNYQENERNSTIMLNQRKTVELQGLGLEGEATLQGKGTWFHHLMRTKAIKG